MISVDQAKSIILSSLYTSSSELVAISESHNRTLSENIYSPINFPPFRASTMDGYAVKYSETPGTFRVSKPSRTGDCSNELSPGFCSYITTGAAVPDYADAVIPIEEVKILQDFIEIPKCSQNQFIRAVGSDITQSELVGEKDTKLTPQHIALLASIGLTQVPVKKTVKIGIVSTGSELKEIGQPLGFGEIIDSNRLMLKLLLKDTGVTVKDYGIISDSYEETRNVLLQMSDECDFWISSGGVSMGDRDFVKPLIEAEGQVLFGRVNMKPGKPMTFGKVKNSLVFALPGNPVSCFVCYYLFVRFAVDSLLNNPHLAEITVTVQEKLRLDPRPEYQRAVVKWENNRFVALSTGSQQSSRLLSTLKSNAILILPGKTDSISEICGDVKAILLEGFQSTEKKTDHLDLQKKVEKVAVVTISDRAFKGEYQDKTGPDLIKRCLEQWKCEILYEVVPDEHEDIKKALMKYINCVDVIFTTGGTGFAPRDRTPEVTREVIDKEAPGLVAKMVYDGMKNTEFACLSRQVAGSKGRTLIVNFPGSPGGVSDCFLSIYKLVPHIVFLLKQE